MNEWAQKTAGWIQEYGMTSLCRSLQLKIPHNVPLTDIRLFGIGRSAAHFHSYGYVTDYQDIVICTWAQFIRVRYEVGPADNVFHDIYEQLLKEQNDWTTKQPLKHTITSSDYEIIFEDIWCSYEE